MASNTPVILRRPQSGRLEGRPASELVTPALELRGVRRVFLAAGPNRGVGWCRFRAASGRGGRFGRTVGRRKIDPVASSRLAGTAGRRNGADRRRIAAVCPTAADPAAPFRIRFCLSVPPFAAGIFGPGERDAAADDCRRRAGRAREKATALLTRVGLRRAPGIGRRGFPAANSSGSRSSGHWRTTRRSCWATSPPGISTTRPARGSWIR